MKMEKANQSSGEVKSFRNGWFKVWREDRDRIIEQCEGAAPTVLSVWDALCDLANEQNSNSFTASIGIIRIRAGLSRASAFRALELLRELGMVSHESNADPDNKKRLLPSTYRLLTPSHKKTTPSLSKQRGFCNRGLKTSSLTGRQDVKGSAQGIVGNALSEQPPKSAESEKGGCVDRF